LERLRASLPSGEDEKAVFQRERYKQMERWHGFLGDIMPFIQTLAGKF